MDSNIIPVKEAEKIARKYGQRIVVMVCWEVNEDEQSQTTHVVTYGMNEKECEWACDLGNQIKRKVLKWPEEQCNAKPEKKGELPPPQFVDETPNDNEKIQ